MKKSIYCLLISCLFITSFTASAESQKAHIHGVATVTLAIEGKMLEMLIESPADGLVGFEHKASSKKEKQAVNQAEKLLKSPQLLFSFKGTSCQSEEVNVDLSKLIQDEHDHHEEKHAHKHEHEHENESHSDNQHESEHVEISATYLLSCDKAASLESVSIELLKLFPRIKKVKAMWITEKSQGAELLDRTKNEISLR